MNGIQAQELLRQMKAMNERLTIISILLTVTLNERQADLAHQAIKDGGLA